MLLLSEKAFFAGVSGRDCSECAATCVRCFVSLPDCLCVCVECMKYVPSMHKSVSINLKVANTQEDILCSLTTCVCACIRAGIKDLRSMYSLVLTSDHKSTL